MEVPRKRRYEQATSDGVMNHGDEALKGSVEFEEGIPSIGHDTELLPVRH